MRCNIFRAFKGYHPKKYWATPPPSDRVNVHGYQLWDQSIKSLFCNCYANKRHHSLHKYYPWVRNLLLNLQSLVARARYNTYCNNKINQNIIILKWYFLDGWWSWLTLSLVCLGWERLSEVGWRLVILCKIGVQGGFYRVGEVVRVMIMVFLFKWA